MLTCIFWETIHESEDKKRCKSKTQQANMLIFMVLLLQQPWQTTSASSNCPHSVSLLLGQSTSPSSSPVQFTKLKTTGKLRSPNTASLPAIAPENKQQLY